MATAHGIELRDEFDKVTGMHVDELDQMMGMNKGAMVAVKEMVLLLLILSFISMVVLT